MKAFKGKVETTDGTRASAALSIDETTLTIHAEGERLGSWGFGTVEVRRSASDRFVLDLAEERLVFIANDPIDFAYTVPGWIAAHQPKKRWGVKKRLGERKAGLITRIEKSGGRRRTQKLARSQEHIHTWRQQSLPGGLIRRICEECDHVSIDLREAEADEEIGTKPEAPSTTA